MATESWLLVLVLASCRSEPSAPVASDPEPWSDAWILREGQRFVGDTTARRGALEASLTNHENLYSRQRLNSYALGDRGWDLLPVWNPRSIRVTAPVAASLERGDIPELPATQPPLWDGVAPTTMDAWIALGRRVFLEYPMRAEVFMEYGLTDPALAAAVGVEHTADGGVPGLVVFANIDGETRVGITCAICHATVKHGELVIGAAHRSFDYGRLRVTYDQIHRTPVNAALQQRMAHWGPGRADVTEDDDEDPVTIPDLWGLRAQRWLTQAGTIRQDSPMALAIRQETQLIDSNHQLIRPPRDLAWALAMFVYSLSPPAHAAEASPIAARGRTVFDAHCKRCHSNAAYGGPPIAATTIGTDPRLANGRGRGTGAYRAPPLLDVRDGAPYLHHGAVASLAELLSPERLAPTYAAGYLGPGPIAGHPAGTSLVAEDRTALLAFLETL